MKLDIVSTRRFSREERWARKTFRVLKDRLRLENTYIELYLVDDEYTVHAYEPASLIPRFDIAQLKVLGDIFISPRYIKENPLTHEGYEADFVFFLIHGLLHLLGRNHARVSDRVVMEKEEEKLWRIVMA